MNRITNYLATLAMGVGLLTYGMSANAACVSTDNGTGIQTQTFYAGQTIEVGTVSVEVVDSNLIVSYNTTGGWQLQETHLWVGEDTADMPQTRKGTPKIGNFPNASGDITGATTHTETISLADLNFACPGDDTMYYVAAHAAVQKVGTDGSIVQTETAWADGDRFVDKGMWGTRFNVTLTCDCSSQPPVTGGKCETAFAYSGGTNALDELEGDITNSFLDIDEDGDSAGDFNRWGWSNGAVGEGTYEWDIYAGAGQSDITKGTLVGTLTVNYYSGDAEVTFAIDPSTPYYMDETHLYVGSEILPRDNGSYTVAPGQYPTIHDGDELNGYEYFDSYYIENLSGSVYVVAHATVCGFPEEPEE